MQVAFSATGGNSTSEQSVVVVGYRAAVVNNYWSGTGGEVRSDSTRVTMPSTRTCTMQCNFGIFSLFYRVTDKSCMHAWMQFCENATSTDPWLQHICPAVLGEAAAGIAQYAIDPATCTVTQVLSRW